MTSRIVTPELLDELPPGDPAAQASRADLRRLNWLMGHAGLIARELRSSPAVTSICDLGSGDGELMLRVAKKLRWRDVRLTLVDRQNVMDAEKQTEFARLGWQLKFIQGDVFGALQTVRRFDAITTNLFLHHFQPEKLTELLGLIAARARFFIACEPRRSALGAFASRSIGLIGCNRVTRHDAVASVKAGFTNSEITAHWPDAQRWRIVERSAGLFSQLFVAQRS
jgi:hypothetical protein